jgi:H+/Cl- antiporter ClcA
MAGVTERASDTHAPDELEGDVPLGGEEMAVRPAQPVHPYLHVIAVAVIAAVAVLAWLVVYEVLNDLLWENQLLTANPWLFPAICLPFCLAVGLLVKNRAAPTNLGESMLETFSGDVTRIAWRTLPVNVVMAWVSLLSGAVLGPEGGIGGIASKIAALYGEKMVVPVEQRSRLVFSTLASAYNGLVANPLFTGVLGSELVKDPEARTRNLPANLIGGSIGFLIFFAAGNTGLEDYLHLGDPGAIALPDVLVVIVMALAGMLLAVIGAGLFRVASAIFGRFEGREVERALAAGLVFSAVGMVAPILLFSGESQIRTIAADPTAYGAGVLLAMAVVKLALLAVAFKAGFLGGPTFPGIFASVCVALAVTLVVPSVSEPVVIGGVMAGFLTVLFRAPFLVILLTSIMLQATPELIALIVLAVAAVLIAQPYLLAAASRRRQARGSTA